MYFIYYLFLVFIYTLNQAYHVSTEVNWCIVNMLVRFILLDAGLYAEQNIWFVVG